MSQRHIISTQRIELGLNHGIKTFELQQKVSKYYWNKILPELQNLFDDLIPHDKVIRIERLEIDLGNVKAEELVNEPFVKKLIRQLKEELSELIKPENNVLSKRTKPQSNFDQWLYFLEHGSLPWQSSHPDNKLLSDVLSVLALESASIDKLQQLAKQDKNVLSRLVYQYDDHFLCNIIEVFSGHNQKALISLLSELERIGDLLLKVSAEKFEKAGMKKEHMVKIFTGTHLRKIYWHSILTYSVVEAQRLSWTELTAEFIFGSIEFSDALGLRKILKSKDLSSFTHFAQILKSTPSTTKDSPRPHRSSDASNPSNPPACEAGIHENKVKDTQTSSKTNDELSGDASTHPEEAATGRTEQASTDAISEENIPNIHENDVVLSDTKKIKEGSEWYINNAGLVLVHPFLSSLYKNIDLIEKNKFKDQEAHQKAVQLLSYLQYGEDEVHEFRLVLAKFLCNYPIEQPLQKKCLLTAGEKEEGASMLEAIITQWGALGNTSPDGLREGFLIRDGKLSKKANGWYLQVEQHTLDVLLDRLPWSINMVKLPWMKELLKVDWR